MSSVQNIRCNISPEQSIERATNVCTCDRPKKPQTNYEQIEAEKQLKEIFRRELRKDIFKLCEELDGFDRKGSRKSHSARLALKKKIFLPPLKRTRGTRKTESLDSFDWSEFSLGFDGRDRDGRDRDGRESRSSCGEMFRSYSSSNMGMSRQDFGSAYGEYEGDDYSDIYGMRRSLWDKHNDDLLKYYQLKKIAEKLDARADKVQKRSIRDNSDYEMGYKLGFGEGYKLAYQARPIYRDFSEKDHVHDELGEGEDFAYENEESIYGESELSCYAITKPTPDKPSKTIHITTKPEDELSSYAITKPTPDKPSETIHIPTKPEDELSHYAITKPTPDKPSKTIHITTKPEDELSHYAITKPTPDKPSETIHTKPEDELSHYAIRKPTPDKPPKTIYITTKPENIDDLREIFKDVDIQMVRKRQFSKGTDKIISETTSKFIKSYKSTVLSDKSPDLISGFVDGFYDAFYQTFIYNPSDQMFDDNEKLYVREVRKCISFDDKDTAFDRKALLARSEDLKQNFKGIIDVDAYEKRIETLGLKKPLTFTKSDFIFFYNYRKKRRKPTWDRLRIRSKDRGKKMLTDSGHDDSDFKEKCKKKTGNDRAWDYMNKHKIVEIFRYMGTMLCSYKPDDPIDFLINLLDKCLLFRLSQIRSKAPLVFTEKHVESIYQNMDPLNYGHIDGNQYLYGLNLLDITEDNDITLVQNTDPIDKNVFLMNANDRLLEKFKDMIAICYN